MTSAATWTSSPSSIASISNDLGTQGVATGSTPGQATITAVFAGFVGASTLHVSNATLTSIIVAPAATDVAAGAKVQFTATGHFSDGTTLVLTTQSGVGFIGRNRRSYFAYRSSQHGGNRSKQEHNNPCISKWSEWNSLTIGSLAGRSKIGRV